MIHLTCNITNLYYLARWYNRELCNSLFERVSYCIYAIPHHDTSLIFLSFLKSKWSLPRQKFAMKILLSKSPRRSGLWTDALSGSQPRSNWISSKSSSCYIESNLRPPTLPYPTLGLPPHQPALWRISGRDWKRPNQGKPAHRRCSRKNWAL